ncbi:MAG TPA: aldo/keto reductase [Phycisphaerae bacterium]|nr:aldo/keto reductase [Phycisphaerae bacterium]
MQYRRLGESDLNISVVTFGAWAIGGWMWGGQDEADAVAAIRKAIDLGVTTIDTAAVYGFGASEELIAKAVGKDRDRVLIFTKYGLRWDTDKGTARFETQDLQGRPITVRRYAAADGVIHECEQSLRRLGTDHIDLYQCHWPDPDTPIEETMGAIERLIKDGKVRYAGLSNYSVEEIAAARKIVPIVSDQPPYSMLRRGIEDDILPYCRKNNVGVIVYSPLQRGILTGKVTMDRQFEPGDHRADMPEYQPANRKRVLAFLDELRPIADAHGATLAQLVVNWTVHRDGVTAALVGARNPRQAEENAKALDFDLSEEETRGINELVDGIKLDM